MTRLSTRYYVHLFLPETKVKQNRKFIVLSLFLYLSLAPAAYGQTEKKSHSASKPQKSESDTLMDSLKRQKIHFEISKKSFVEAMQLIRDKTKLNFIVDDIPGDDIFTLKDDSDVASLLTKFSHFYDYTWKIGEKGEIQMLRQFGKPTDLPQVNLPELRQFGVEIMSLLSVLGVDTTSKEPSEFKLKKLYQSLTTNQVNSMKNGTGIPATQLSPVQFSLLKEVTSSYIWTVPAIAFSEFASLMTNLPSTYLQVIDDNGDPVLFLNRLTKYDREYSTAMRVFEKPDAKK